MLRVMVRSGYEHPHRNASDQRDRFSERRVDGFALERKNCEDAFVDAVERLAADEPLQRLDTEGELPEGQRPLPAQAPRSQPGQVRLEIGRAHV